MPPFRKLRQERTAGRRATISECLYYDFQQMRTAFTGTVPIIGASNPYACSSVSPPDRVRPKEERWEVEESCMVLFVASLRYLMSS